MAHYWPKTFSMSPTARYTLTALADGIGSIMEKKTETVSLIRLKKIAIITLLVNITLKMIIAGAYHLVCKQIHTVFGENL